MIIYVVIVCDRHTDDEIYLFEDKERALWFARDEADKAAKCYREEPDEELNDAMIKGGWIFNSSIEDCGSVRVKTKKLMTAA
jgi:hypothetical protein